MIEEARRQAAPPWEATGECFVDPDTGRLVQLWWLPVMGERHYVDIGAPAAALT